MKSIKNYGNNVRGTLESKYHIYYISRERKRERERDDLWKKLENLSLTNAKKEGISLELVNHHHTSEHSTSLNSE